MLEKVSLDLTQDPKVIFGQRLFDAPRELVFQAWTKPEHLAEWWGPNGFTLTTHSFDFKPGGVWRFVMHGPDGRDYQNRVTFDEIVRPERIAYHHGGGDDVEPVQFRTVATFEDVGGKTKLTWRATFPSAAAREHVIKEYGADKGLVQTMTRLGDFVETLSNGARCVMSTTTTEDFVITRTLDAPRDLVWKAFTDPKRMAKWWGPKGFKVIHSKMDLRPGGFYHYGMEAPNGTPMWGKFVFREIVAPERLVFINSFSDEAGGVTRHPLHQSWPLTLLSTFTFEEEKGGKTKLTIRWSPHNATEEERETFEAGRTSMNQGWSGTLEQLEAYLKDATAKG